MEQKNTTVERQWISAHRVAREIGLSYSATLRLVADGFIPSVQVGLRRLVHVDALARCMARVRAGEVLN